MEKGRTALRDGHTATIYPDGALSAQNKNNRFDKQEKDFIYISVHDIGVELMAATSGADITYDNLLSLQFRGYLDYSLDEIFCSHYDDLEDLNKDVRFGYEQYLESMATQEAQITAEMETAKLPQELFKKVEFVAVEGISAEKIHKSGNSTLIKDVGIIKDGEIGREEKLRRYTRYKLAEKLLKPVRHDISEQRLVGIALGIFLDKDNPNSGKKISSYQSEILKASNQAVNQADVEMAAETAGWYDFIYPERRQKHFKEIRAAAEKPVIVKLEDVRQLYPLTTPEISMDIRRKRLLLGKTAVEAALGKGTKPESIHKLGELLLAESMDYHFYQHNANRYANWNKGDFIQYGRWLMNLIANDGSGLTKQVMKNGAQLGLGPAAKPIGRVFGYHYKFLLDVGTLPNSHHSMFEEWTFEDFVSHIKRVAEESGTQPTRELLLSRIKEGLLEPSPTTIQRYAGSLSAVLEAAGFELHNRQLSHEDMLNLGVAFVRDHGRYPKGRDLYRQFAMPTYRVLRKHYSSLKQYNEALANLIELEEEYLQAA